MSIYQSSKASTSSTKRVISTKTKTKTTSTSNSSKRKSKFKKCPNAPKRFKSAYIFFSTDMMQKIKAQQKGSADEKQKITDISKRISTAWKNLKPDERAKWNLIAKKDKERFLEEKRNYKGPWQLPVKQQGVFQHHQVTERRNQSSAFTEPSTTENYNTSNMISKNDNSSSTSCTMTSSLPHSSSWPTAISLKKPNTVLPRTPSELKLHQVSQEERDAAHNLVSLHMQNMNYGSRRNSSNSFSTLSSVEDAAVVHGTTAGSTTAGEGLFRCDIRKQQPTKQSHQRTNHNKKNSWSSENMQPLNRFQGDVQNQQQQQQQQQPVYPTTAVTTACGTFPPIHYPHHASYYSNHHNLFRPEAMNVQYCTEAGRLELINRVSVIGRMQKIVEYSQHPPRRFTFARSP